MNTMKLDCIIAIDPGMSGGIAVKETDKEVKVYKMPRDIRDTYKIFKKYHVKHLKTIVVMEFVGQRADDTGGKNVRVGKLTKNFDQIQAVCAISDIACITVAPQTWQRTLRLTLKGEAKNDRKTRYKAFAQTKYPNIKATLWNADALCILSFAIYIYKNDQDYITSKLEPGHVLLFKEYE